MGGTGKRKNQVCFGWAPGDTTGVGGRGIRGTRCLVQWKVHGIDESNPSEGS